MSIETIQHWLIRSPYQHQTWDDVLLRNRFRLQGIRNAEAARNCHPWRASRSWSPKQRRR